MCVPSQGVELLLCNNAGIDKANNCAALLTEEAGLEIGVIFEIRHLSRKIMDPCWSMGLTIGHALAQL